MLYELIAIVRPGRLAEVKELCQTAGNIVLSSGGTIRSIKNWGVFALPKRIRKHQAVYDDGHYFVMRFDSSVAAQQNVRETLGLDPRMIKFNAVKLGDGKLESMAKVGSRMLWSPRDRVDSVRET